MTEQTAAPSPAPAESINTPSPDDALKSIASEFTVEEQARQFTATPYVQPQPQPAFTPPAPFIPDPVTDAEGYRAWVHQQIQAQSQVQSEIRQVTSELSQLRQERVQQKVNADVDRAVQIVNQKLKVEPDLAEALLNMEYAKNPTFRRIFDNRDKNPIAFDKALGVLSDKFHSKVQVRQDPQLAENVRAAQSSQRTMATTKQNSQQEEIGNMSDADFQRWWSQNRG